MSEADRQARLLKAQKYAKAMGLLLHKMNDRVFDEDGWKLTAALADVNPDLYSLWSYRRQLLHQRLLLQPFDDSILESEQKATERGLLRNPKSYGSWHHRLFVLQMTCVATMDRLSCQPDVVSKCSESFESFSRHRWPCASWTTFCALISMPGESYDRSALAASLSREPALIRRVFEVFMSELQLCHSYLDKDSRNCRLFSNLTDKSSHRLTNSPLLESSSIRYLHLTRSVLLGELCTFGELGVPGVFCH